MANKGNTRIARDARLTAEADFATWLMMAKLGSFDDLPKDAQAFLSQYRERLKTDAREGCRRGHGRRYLCGLLRQARRQGRPAAGHRSGS